MIKDLLLKRKNLMIILPIVVVLIIVMVIVDNNGGMVRNDRDISKVPYKTEKKPIITRFPKFGEIDSCYWKANTIGKTDFGPTSYWMKGFAVLSKNDFERLKKKFQWKAMEASWKPELDTDILNLKSFSWYKSESFNTQTGSLIGYFFLDFENGVIYFDVEK